MVAWASKRQTKGAAALTARCSIHTQTHTQWGKLNGNGRNPTNFELSVLLTTPNSDDAASWLDAIPLKLPPGESLTGLEQTVVHAERYPAPPNGAANFEQDDYRAPFTYAHGDPAEINEAQANVLAQVAQAAAQQQAAQQQQEE